VWVDELGEWPLCKRCLAQVQADQARRSLSEASGGETEPQPETGVQPSVPANLNEEDLPTSPASRSMDAIRLLLTRREFEVAQMAHLTNRQIADRLGISIGTVKTQLHSIRQKLGLRTRADLIRFFSAPEKLPQQEGAPPPLTFSLTIKGPLDRLHEIISRLVRGR